MKINLMHQDLTLFEKNEINKLLNRKNSYLDNDLDQMWYLIDLIWDDYGCDNKNLNWDEIGKFYSHPVWILNCLFAEQDKVSRAHREALGSWISNQKFDNVLDYGGGSGSTSIILMEKKSDLLVSIYEPYPNDFGNRRVSKFNNISFVKTLKDDFYDCLISTDVLEHVESPLKDLYQMIKSVKHNGFLVIGCPFYPMIKCHLPRNFHFRFTFNLFARLMGLKVIGKLEGSPQTIYKRINIIEPNWWKITQLKKISMIFFPVLQFIKALIIPFWRLYIKNKG
jgi:hypothetical protein